MVTIYWYEQVAEMMTWFSFKILPEKFILAQPTENSSDLQIQ